MLKPTQIFPIGIGTFKLDLENPQKTLQALLHSFDKGQNFMSTSLLYDNGKVVDFLQKFFQEVKKDELFLSCHLEKNVEKKEDVEKQLDEYLQKMKIDYVDSLQVHLPHSMKMPLLEIYEEMDKLVKKGKVRFLSASNTTLEQLKELQQNFKLVSFEGVYNLECKYYENVGVMEFCKQNEIQFVCYQALRRNNIAKMNHPFLVKMAEKYNKTQNQILLNWLVKEKGVSTLIKTNTIQNIESNLEALDFAMEKEDLESLNDFQDERFHQIEIDWKNQGGVSIDQLANQFKIN